MALQYSTWIIFSQRVELTPEHDPLHKSFKLDSKERKIQWCDKMEISREPSKEPKESSGEEELEGLRGVRLSTLMMIVLWAGCIVFRYVCNS